MDQYLIPSDASFVEDIARAIAKNRLYKEALANVRSIPELDVASTQMIEDSFESVFEALWAGTSELDELQKAGYRSDALAAIRSINLKLITSA
jgi:hypothetical protein